MTEDFLAFFLVGICLVFCVCSLAATYGFFDKPTKKVSSAPPKPYEFSDVTIKIGDKTYDHRSFGGSFRYDGKSYDFEKSGNTIRPPAKPIEQEALKEDECPVQPLAKPPISPEPSCGSFSVHYDMSGPEWDDNEYWKEWSRDGERTKPYAKSDCRIYDPKQHKRGELALLAASEGMLAWAFYRHGMSIPMACSATLYRCMDEDLRSEICANFPNAKENRLVLDAMVEYDLRRAFEELTGTCS